MKKRYYIITAIVTYFVFLVITIPAKPIINLINNNNIISIQGINGTLWNGKARIINIDNTVQLENTKWSFSAWKLLLGEIAVDVDTHYSSQTITTEIGSSFFGKLFVNNLKGKITAADVTTLANIPLAQLSGLITVNIEHAEWKQGELPLAKGFINWNNAVVTVAESASLGNVSITLQESDEHLLTANIKNQGGDIKISGNANLIQPENYSVNINLLPTASANNNIKQSLNLFAQKQKNGSYQISNNGSLNQIGLL